MTTAPAWPTTQDDPFDQAVALIDAGEDAEAIPLLRLALAETPDDRSERRGTIDYWLGVCLANTHRYADALEFLAEASREYGRTDGEAARIGEADVLNMIAFCKSELGRPVETVAMYEELLERRRELHGDDHANVYQALTNLAITLVDVGRSHDALDYADEAAALAVRLTEAGEVVDVAQSLEVLASIYDKLGRVEEAIPLWKEALDLRLADAEGRDDAGVARDLNYVGLCYHRAGMLEEARPYYESSIAMHRRLFPENDPALFNPVNNLAALLNAYGDCRRALEWYHEAYVIASSAFSGTHPTLALIHNNLGTCHANLGETARALTYYQAGLEMRRDVYGDTHPMVAQSLANVGGALIELGRPEQALPLLRESFEQCRALFPDDNLETAQSLITLGKCLDTLDRDDEALFLFDQALAIREAIIPGASALVVDARNRLGSSYSALGRDEEALETFTQVLAECEKLFPGDHPDVHAALGQVSVTLARLGRRDEAIEHCRRSLEMARRLDARDRYIVAAMLGELLVADPEHLEEAESLFTEATDQIEALRLESATLTEEDRATFYRELKQYGAYEGIVRAQLLRGRPDRALAAVERARGRSALDLLERGAVDPLAEVLRRAERDGDDETLALVRPLAERIAAAERDVVSLGRAIARVDRDATLNSVERLQRRNELDARMRAGRGALREAERRGRQVAGDRFPLTPMNATDELSALLEAGERLFVYALAEEGSHVFVVDDDGDVRAHELLWDEERPVRASEIEVLVDQHLGALRRREGACAAGGTGALLFQALVPREAWAALRSAPLVYVVPHGPLFRLPLETLVHEPAASASEARFWLDDGPPLAYGASIAVLAACRARRDRRGVTPTLELLALGDPDFESEIAAPEKSQRFEIDALRDRHGALTRLPATGTECRTIEAALAGGAGDAGEIEGVDSPTVLLLGKEATERRLFELAPRARYLHLATHGIVDETDLASYSSLALTPVSADPGDDGFLRLRDLLRRWAGRLEACELVVLSACESQRGRLQLDEGYFAMPIGFLYAGAPAVVASHWKVEDESTAELMGEFYRCLARREGASRLDAFTAARRVLRQERPEPFYWAPFTYLGDPRW